MSDIEKTEKTEQPESKKLQVDEQTVKDLAARNADNVKGGKPTLPTKSISPDKPT
jgi:hypothetical protein